MPRTSRLAAAVLLLGLAVGCGFMPPPSTAPYFGPPITTPPGGLVRPEVAPDPVPPEDAKSLAEGNTAFALDLYKRLAAKNTGNVVVSPYSVSSALAMTYAGAKGQTADEMAKALHFTLPQDKLHPAFAGSSYSLRNSGKDGGCEIAIANALWAQRGLTLEPAFTGVTDKSYAAGMRQVDFAADPEVARKMVNEWIADKTNDKIKDLLAPGDVDVDTRLALTNAVRFAGTWKTQFDPKDTKDRDFEVAPGETVKVPTMFRADMRARQAYTDDFRLLELPYEGDRWRMLFLLPPNRGRLEGEEKPVRGVRKSLKDVEAALTSKTLADAIANLHRAEEFDVAVPRFKLRYSCHLNDELKKLGMPTAFSDAADFSGITRAAELSISSVVHEARIEVDEKGTVADAATVSEMHQLSGPERFLLDRPFLFLLRDNTTGTILFVGRVTDPR